METLRGVSAIACEDTRVTGKLLKHLDIRKRMIRYDDHASETDREKLLALIRDEPVALVSDLPGYEHRVSLGDDTRASLASDLA